jgi:CRP-like cAMP-binding protein
MFKELPPAALAAIEKQCAWRTYQPGESVIDYLDASSEVFFVVSGEARASIYSVEGKAVTFSDLGPGDMFGEYAAIDGALRSTGIVARTPCLVASMSANNFWNVLESEPLFATALLRQSVAKVRELTTRIYEFSALAVNNRIQAELLRLAGLASSSGNTAQINPAPIHADIASRTSTHREAVTRELSRLSKLGIVERRGGALVIKDVSRLTAMVHAATGE